MRDIPGPGMEPVCPAFAGGLFMTKPPGKAPMWTILRVFIEFVPVLILFYVLLFFWPCDVWDLVSPSGDWTHTLCSPAVESEVLATEPGGKSLSTLYRYPCACGYLSLLSPCGVNALDSVCLCVSLLHTKGVRLVAWNPSWLGVFTPWKLASATNGPPPLQIVVDHLPA